MNVKSIIDRLHGRRLSEGSEASCPGCRRTSVTAMRDGSSIWDGSSRSDAGNTRHNSITLSSCRAAQVGTVDRAGRGVHLSARAFSILNTFVTRHSHARSGGDRKRPAAGSLHVRFTPPSRLEAASSRGFGRALESSGELPPGPGNGPLRANFTLDTTAFGAGLASLYR